MIVEIADIEAPAIAAYSKLTESQLRNRLEPKKGIFIAESPKVIKIALQEGYEILSMLTEQRHIDGDAKELIAQCGDIPIYTGEKEVLQKITGYELTRGVLCAIRRPAMKDAETLIDGKKRIAILDNVVNATNTGAIFRAATALGIESILLTKTCSDPLNRRSVRVSMGTVLQMPWGYLDGDIPSSMKLLHQHGIKSVALALSDKALDIDDAKIANEERLALVLGTEGDGLSDEAIKACDYTARIPMQRGVDSLNVAGAAAVAFWELRKR